MKIDLNNRVAIVTGGAEGIGKEISRQFLKEGTKVAIWDNNQVLLESSTQEFNEQYPESCIGIVCDVSSSKDVLKATMETNLRFGTIDILVANAGVVNTQKVCDISEADWDRVFNVNTKGVFLCCKNVAEIFKKNFKGRIIIASSFAAIIPSVGSSAYASSKSAVKSLTRVLASELAPFNITVNCYAPGMIPTSMSKIEEFSKDRQEEMLDSLSIREWGKAEDIASLVIFLASDQARYITGTMIDASGGKFATQFPKLAW